MLKRLVVFIVSLGLWGLIAFRTNALMQSSSYDVKLINFRPCLNTTAGLTVFVEYQCSVTIPKQLAPSRAWMLIMRNGQGAWTSLDVPTQGLQTIVKTWIPGKLSPGIQDIQVLLFHEKTSLPLENLLEGTIPSGWQPKAKDTLHVTLSPFSFPADTETIWVGTIPVGCDVYVAPREEVLTPTGEIDLATLEKFYIGKGPVTVKANPGEYVVAIEVGTVEGQEFVPDESDITYWIREDKKIVAMGRAYFVTKRWLQPEVVIGLFQPEGLKLDQLGWLYPEQQAFKMLPENWEHTMADLQQEGYPVPDEKTQQAMISLIKRGGKSIWATPWISDRRTVIIIIKQPQGHSVHIIMLTRHR